MLMTAHPISRSNLERLLYRGALESGPSLLVDLLHN